jgi:hypothetical protein
LKILNKKINTMKRLLFAGLFLMAANFSFAADKCTADCHKTEHKCTKACHKDGAGHIANHGEKGHICTTKDCKHDCSAACKK